VKNGSDGVTQQHNWSGLNVRYSEGEPEFVGHGEGDVLLFAVGQNVLLYGDLGNGTYRGLFDFDRVYKPEQAGDADSER
jgi:hypothetical protein